MARFYTETWRRIIDLSWPVVTTGAVRTTMRTVDLLVVGLFVGSTAVAAVGIADVFTRIVLHVALGLGAGTIALVSQSYGAERHSYANVVTTQSIVFGFLLGIPIAIGGWFLADVLFVMLGAESAVVALGSIYFSVIILTAPFRIVGMLSSRALQ